jgi:hypothetical protein
MRWAAHLRAVARFPHPRTRRSSFALILFASRAEWETVLTGRSVTGRGVLGGQSD